MKEIRLDWGGWACRAAQSLAIVFMFVIGMVLISKGLLAMSQSYDLLVATGIAMVLGGLGAWLFVGVQVWNVIARSVNKHKRNGGQQDEKSNSNTVFID